MTCTLLAVLLRFVHEDKFVAYSYRFTTPISAGMTLFTLITDDRTAGMSWRLIARHLYELTDHAVDVAPETVRNWSEVLEVAA